jgi:hypothetical protein
MPNGEQAAPENLPEMYANKNRQAGEQVRCREGGGGVWVGDASHPFHYIREGVIEECAKVAETSLHPFVRQVQKDDAGKAR